MPSGRLTTPDRISLSTVALMLSTLSRSRESAADDALHAVDDKADRCARVHHHDAGRVVGRRLVHSEHVAQAHHRQHRAAQVRETLEIARSQRHLDDGRQADDLLDLDQGDREDLLFHAKGDELAPRLHGRVDVRVAA